MTGLLGDHQRFMPRLQLSRSHQLETRIAALDQEAAEARALSRLNGGCRRPFPGSRDGWRR